MTRQYKRYLDVNVTGSGGTLNLSSFRVVFEIEKQTLQQPNPAVIRIYNLKRDTAEKIKKDFKSKTITVDAGYEDNHGLIYKGNIRYVRVGRENPTDTFVEIYGGEGSEGLRHGVVNKTLPKGSTPKHIYDAAAEALNPYGIEPGYIGTDLSQPRYPRPIVLYGAARDILRTLAISKQSTFSVQEGKLDIVANKSDGKPGEGITLNQNTGLIGMPVETVNGIMVRALINPSFTVLGKLTIDQASIQEIKPEFDVGGEQTQAQQLAREALKVHDGVYKIIFIKWVGDSFGNDWYADMTCVGKTGDPGIPGIIKENPNA
jgi:hypothetical protein